jgi:CBS domain containing-hemolysin-like protein
MTLFLLLFAVGFSLTVSAVCSLMEATLLSLTPGQVAELQRRRPIAGAIWAEFKKDVERPISVILICNTASHTIGATVAGAEFEELARQQGWGGGWSVFAFGAVFTVLMLQFTEILPKSLGVRYNTTIAGVTARPMAWIVRAMGPVLAAIKFINKPFDSGKEHAPVSVDEIATLAAMARGGKVISEQQEQMIRAAGRLRQITARQVMTPRKDVHTLKLADPFPDSLQKIRKTPYTRLPVLDEGGWDRVRGVVHLRDVFNALALQPGRFHVEESTDVPGELKAVLLDGPGGEMHVIGAGELDLASLVRPVPFVPETQSLEVLLRGFQQGFETPDHGRVESHIAVVVDEYGNGQGIVTLEDVLEELVGDIEDEFDSGERQWNLHREGETWIADGEVPLRELAQRLGVDEEHIRQAEHGGEVVTLGGYVTRELGRFPNVGDTMDFAGFTLRIERVEDGRVMRAVLLATASATT